MWLYKCNMYFFLNLSGTGEDDDYADDFNR